MPGTPTGAPKGRKLNVCACAMPLSLSKPARVPLLASHKRILNAHGYKCRYLSLNPNRDNPNSWMSKVLWKLHLTQSPQCYSANSLNLKEFYMVLFVQIKQDLPVHNNFGGIRNARLPQTERTLTASERPLHCPPHTNA